jgi:hypothetical protein
LPRIVARHVSRVISRDNPLKSFLSKQSGRSLGAILEVLAMALSSVDPTTVSALIDRFAG